MEAPFPIHFTKNVKWMGKLKTNPAGIVKML